MNKFKFGDKVMHCDYGYGIVIDSEVSATLGQLHEVAFKGFRCGMIETVKELDLKPASGWVKCADKSPPFNKYVLIWDGEDQDVDWLSDTAPNEFKESHITHWMPLPAPPLEVER